MKLSAILALGASKLCIRRRLPGPCRYPWGPEWPLPGLFPEPLPGSLPGPLSGPLPRPLPGPLPGRLPRPCNRLCGGSPNGETQSRRQMQIRRQTRWRQQGNQRRCPTPKGHENPWVCCANGLCRRPSRGPCQGPCRGPQRRNSKPKKRKPPALNSKAPLDRGVGGRYPKPKNAILWVVWGGSTSS